MVTKDYSHMIKGKRTKRPRPASPLALTMATISSSTADVCGGGGFSIGGFISSSDPCITLTPSASNSGEFTQSTFEEEEEEEDMANCLILLAKGRSQTSSLPFPAAVNKAAVAVKVEVYRCKTCNKSFSSFQALGGHRASHKRPIKPNTALEKKKPLIADYQEENVLSTKDDNTILSLKITSRGLALGSPQNKSRVHECSMCGAKFASGHALGGHMRRHRQLPPPVISSHNEFQEAKKPRNPLSLDLNLPAPEDDPRESKFPFPPKEQIIVFSPSPLVDCHY